MRNLYKRALQYLTNYYDKIPLQKNIKKKYLTGKIKPSDKTLFKIIESGKKLHKIEINSDRREKYHIARSLDVSSKNASSASSLSKEVFYYYTKSISSGIPHEEFFDIKDEFDHARLERYIRLRKIGTYPEFAYIQSLYNDSKIDQLEKRMYNVAKKLARQFNVKIEYILKGMAQNTHRTIDDWENYVRANKINNKK